MSSTTYNYYNRPMQAIGDVNLITGFIQNLLSSTPLPMYDTVTIGDTIIKGEFYIYDFQIIKCTSSGILGANDIPKLYPSNNLYPSDILFPSDGLAHGTYEVIDRYDFGRDYPKFTYIYRHKNNYYDSDTHRELGKYLRCIRDIYGVNYMPFYNCNSQANLFNLDKYYQGKYLYAVPILFNKSYTISYRSSHTVSVRPILYTVQPIEFNGIDQGEEYKNAWESIAKPIQISGRSYLNYLYYKINTRESLYYKHQKYLYLLFSSNTPIQSLSVVEGRYTDTQDITLGNSKESKFMDQAMKESTTIEYDSETFRATTQLQLLSENQRDQSYAFSNRLFEGLLHHTINRQDDIYWDIARVQKKLGLPINGIWGDNIQVSAFKLYTSEQNHILNPQFNYADINGNIDKDVEYYLFGNNISAQEEL